MKDEESRNDSGMPAVEYAKCAEDVAYFVNHFVQIYDATTAGWMSLHPWPSQEEVLASMQRERLLVILKARQLGLSWLACAYALWLLIFRSAATVLLFSQRAAEANELLARIRQMYGHLPLWLQTRATQRDNDQFFELSSGSRALAFSTRGGRSYTGTLAIIDEADYVPDLSAFLNAVKPTVDAGGKLFLISTADKSRPVSTFKNLFRAARTQQRANSPQRHGDTEGKAFTAKDAKPAKNGKAIHRRETEDAEGSPQRQGDTENSGGWLTDKHGGTRIGDESRDESRIANLASKMGYFPIFLPWSARPGRDEAWAARTRAEMYAQRGTDDDWFAEYPASVEEALAPRQLDRRIPLAWLTLCLDLTEGVGSTDIPTLPGITVWTPPQPGHQYVIGADPAEGNPNSDESAATVLDATSWEQVAVLAMRVEPALFARDLGELAQWYQRADVMVERNNHGHTVLAALREAGQVRVLPGLDGRPGWLSNVKGKPILYAALAEAIREQATRIRDSETANQIASIAASTLRAAEGLHDDRADAFALAIAALRYGKVGAEASTAIAAPDPLIAYDSGDF